MVLRISSFSFSAADCSEFVDPPVAERSRPAPSRLCESGDDGKWAAVGEGREEAATSEKCWSGAVWYEKGEGGVGEVGESSPARPAWRCKARRSARRTER